MKHTLTRRRHVAGFTLVELMIAIVIGLFLTAGLLTLVGAMKRTNTSQTGLSQLQDNERIAMNLITDVVQSGGYFPNPVTNTTATFFTATSATTGAPAFLSGQFIAGTGAAADAAPGNLLSVRYTTSGLDNVINCTGNTTATQTTWTNSISVDANGNLQCILTIGTAAPQTPVQLVSGLISMQVLYGVQTNSTVNTNSVDTYLDASQVSAGSYWNNVLSVKVKLTFKNPLVNQPGQSAFPNIQFTRVISVMNKTGVDS
jgi:type IV pilus assembly protein PilW